MSTVMFALLLGGILSIVAGVVTIFYNMYKTTNLIRSETLSDFNKATAEMSTRMKTHAVGMLIMALGGLDLVAVGIYHLVIWLR